MFRHNIFIFEHANVSLLQGDEGSNTESSSSETDKVLMTFFSYDTACSKGKAKPLQHYIASVSCFCFHLCTVYYLGCLAKPRLTWGEKGAGVRGQDRGREGKRDRTCRGKRTEGDRHSERGETDD